MSEGDDSAKAAKAAATNELEFDQQLFAVSGFALIALIGVLVFLLVGLAKINVAVASFQRDVQNEITLISGLVQPAFKAANSILSTFESLATDIYNSIIYVVVHGTQAILNVVIAVGNAALTVIGTGTATLKSHLEDIGGELLPFFQNVFGPILQFVTRAGDLIVDVLIALYNVFSPFLTFIKDIINAINRIGTIFT
jgi:phage-related protein